MEAEIMDDEKDSKQVQVVKKQVPAQLNPAMLLTMAVEQGANLDRLERLMALQERWEAAEAKKAFVHDMAGFKTEPIIVTKDRKNKQYDSNYTSIGNMFNTVTPRLSQYGFSVNFEIEQSDKITVTCIITHKLGHSERVSMSAPPDGSGSKNPIQQIKSTLTYLRAATFEAATGIASSDANLDDDGKGSGLKTIDEKQAADIRALMQEVQADEAGFLKYFKVDSVDSLPIAKFQQAINTLEKKRKK